MRINTNIQAIDVQRNMLAMPIAMTRRIEKLSGGRWISQLVDDAVEPLLSEQLWTQVCGCIQAQWNARDGTPSIQSAVILRQMLGEDQHQMEHTITGLAVRDRKSTRLNSSHT